jgi:predicted dehydrogenase
MYTVSHTPIRVGIVGCGVVADYGHIPAIDRNPHTELVGFADPDPQRREAQSAKYGKPGFVSFAEMVEAVELDAVTVTTQPDVKLDMVRIAATHALHALCEKPLTDTVAQAEELVRLMDGADLFCGVAFVYRGKQDVQRMMELVREGAIGRLRAVHIQNLWDYHGLRDQAIRGDRRHRALQNLGTLDCGVHNLDLARYLSGGDFAEIHAIGTIVEAANRYPDHIITQARMTNGVLVSIEESAVWGYTAAARPHYVQAYRMVGENGVIESTHPSMNSPDSGRLTVVSGQTQWTEDVTSAKAWDLIYGQFYDIIRGLPPAHRIIADCHDALANMRAAREVIAQCGQ